MVVRCLERAYHDLLLRNQVPHDEVRAISGWLGDITSEQYGGVVPNLLDLIRKILGD